MALRTEQTTTGISHSDTDDPAALLGKLQEVRLLEDTLSGASDADEEQRLRRARGVRQQVIEAVVETNLGMVRSIVRRVGRASMSSSADYEQEGIAALIEAAETFDPAKGTWSSWAYRKINSAVLGALHATEFSHLTHREFAQRPELLKELENLEQKYGGAVVAGCGT